MAETNEEISPLADLETHLRELLPAKLYASAWIDPSGRNLTKVFNHLRTLQRILHNYLPRQILESLPKPGETRYQWEEGTLMFTDLAGFTPLLEANATLGQEGAKSLWELLNNYFREMIQIISKGGGNLLEFTGDAILAQFPADQSQSDTSRAVRVGLRMQRAMEKFSEIKILDSEFSLGMRVGLHVGRFLAADIGTPLRMEHVLLGSSVKQSKHAESAGKVGSVCLTKQTRERVKDEFRFEDLDEEFSLVVDDLTDEQLGDYDIVPSRHRMASMVLFDMSVDGLVTAISDAVDKVEPLASFIPGPILNLLVENAASRRLPPDFPAATIMFINLLGLPSLEEANPEEEAEIISRFSQVISLINAEIEARGGVLKKVTYHLAGPDVMIAFGVPNSHTNDSIRASHAALAILKVVKSLPPIVIGDEKRKLSCHIGLTRGRVFAAEIGETQGRREFNMLGDRVNTAARLMNKAESHQILISQDVFEDLEGIFETTTLESIDLKGKAKPFKIYELGKFR